MLVFTFLQDFILASNAGVVHEVAAIWPLNGYLTRPTKIAVISRMKMPNSVNVLRRGALQTYSEVVQLLSNRCAPDCNITNVDGKVRGPRDGPST